MYASISAISTINRTLTLIPSILDWNPMISDIASLIWIISLFDCTDIICDILILNRYNLNIVGSGVKHNKPESENDVSCGSSFYIDSCGC